jgi:hypothetical protein
MRWVGIDEAGYGPNLGPLVMTAVVVEGPEDQPPDLWSDLPQTVDRAGGEADRLWVDDSKRIYRGGAGLDRLETAALAALSAMGAEPPATLSSLLAAFRAGSLEDVELHHWLDDEPAVPREESRAMWETMIPKKPLEGAAWRLVDIRSVVVGPARFNEGLQQGSKARVHFGAFCGLLAGLWSDGDPGHDTSVRADKHGGRHFYWELLLNAFPDTWIDRGEEGAELSRYTFRRGGRRLELKLQPRADSEDGLVALASMVSKMIRELWMGVFNAHWAARIPELRPTAGYPVDSARFRSAIEPHCAARGLAPVSWWRDK